jgi:hypothetical protein
MSPFHQDITIYCQRPHVPLGNGRTTRILLFTASHRDVDLLLTLFFITDLKVRATDGVFEGVCFPEMLMDKVGIA